MQLLKHEGTVGTCIRKNSVLNMRDNTGLPKICSKMFNVFQLIYNNLADSKNNIHASGQGHVFVLTQFKNIIRKSEFGFQHKI